MKAHSEKFTNVSDLQVQDEDDRHDEQSRSKTIKANNKIVIERIWIKPVTSKIVVQPSESDTDAPAAQGACDYSEKSREICISISTRERCPR